jgi:hypothetical protein
MILSNQPINFEPSNEFYCVPEMQVNVDLRVALINATGTEIPFFVRRHPSNLKYGRLS